MSCLAASTRLFAARVCSAVAVVVGLSSCTVHRPVPAAPVVQKTYVPLRAQVHYANAVRAAVLGDAEEVERSLRWVEMLDPDNPHAWVASARVWADHGDHARARRALEACGTHPVCLSVTNELKREPTVGSGEAR